MGPLTSERASAIARNHPLPIADAMAALAAAESRHERRDRVVECFRATVRYVAAVVLATRVQFGPGPAGESAQLGDLMRALRNRGLTDGQWVGLIRQLLGTWAGRVDAYAIPLLAQLFTGKAKKHIAKEIDGLLEMRKAETVAHGATGSAAAIDEVLARREPQLVSLLDRLQEVWRSARLVVPLAPPEDDGAQSAWHLTGYTPHRGLWPRVVLAEGLRLEPGAPVLVDEAGVALVSLDPVAMFRRPSPEAIEELFVLDGAKKKAALFVAFPSMAEHREKEVWATLGRQLFDGDDDEPPPPASGGIARPYRGLSAFGPKHAALFFGRERLVESVANRIRRNPMVTITGPSGSGKSSLLLAGVVPQLEDFTAVVMRPGASPLLVLARRLAEALGPDVDEQALAELLAERPETLGSYLEAQARGGGPPVLLVIDQAEEVFTLCDRGEARLAFAEAVASAGLDAQGSTRVVLSLREDYFARLSTLSPLRGNYSRHVEVVATPDREDLFRILMMPARAFGFSFEDEELLEEMVASVDDEPAALAMLQFCADQLWERRDRTWKRLTRDAYRAVGGVAGALAAHADAVLDGMPAAMQSRARALLLRCVTEDSTRAVVPAHELREALGDEVEEVIERLVEARLLTMQQSDDGSTHTVELVHEALLVHWERLRSWMADDDHLIRIQARIGQAASRWHTDGEPADRLLGEGKPLLEAEELLSHRRDLLRPAEVAFIDASRARSNRARRLRRAAIGGLVLLTLLAAGFGGVAWWARGRAESMQTLAEDNEREATDRTIRLIEEQGRVELLAGRPERAAVFFVDALKRGGEGASLRTMLSDAMRVVDNHHVSWPAQTGSHNSVGTLRFSPDGELVVSADRRGRWWLWKASDQKLIVDGVFGSEGVSVQPRQLRFSGDGKHWAIGTDRGHVTLCDDAGSTVWQRRHGAAIVGLAFTAAGLLTASRDGDLRLWSLDSGEAVARREHPGELRSMSVAPDALRVATGGQDGTFRIYDWDDWKVVHSAAGVGPVRRTAWAASQWASVAERDKTYLEPDESPLGYHTEVPSLGVVSMWRAGDHSLSAELRGAGRVDGWALAPNAEHLALIRFPNTIELWSSKRRRIHRQWSGHERYSRLGESTPPRTREVAFDTRGRYLASYGSDEAVRIWDGASGGLLLPLPHRGQVSALAWRPDGAMIATADQTGETTTLHLWHVRTKRVATWPSSRAALSGESVFTLHGDREPVRWQLSDGGGAAASAEALPAAVGWSLFADPRGRATVWAHFDRLHVTGPDGQQVAELTAFDDGDGPAAIYDARYSAVSERIIVGGTSGRVELWTTAGTLERKLLGHQPIIDVKQVALSAKGDRGAAAARGKIIVWELAGGEQLLETSEPKDGFSLFPEAHFLSDGERLLDTTGALKVRIWDIAGKRAVIEIDGNLVALSGDQRRLLLAQDGSPTAALHDTSSGALVRTFEGHEDALTALALSPDGARAYTGSKDGSVRLWDADSGVALAHLQAHPEAVSSLQASETLLLSSGTKDSAAWSVSLETRDARQLEPLLDAVVPWKLADGRLVPKR